MNERSERRDLNDDAALRAVAPRLGRDAAARLDVDAVARGVAARLRQTPAVAARARRWMAPLRMAAAVALLAGGLLWWSARPGAPEPLVTLPASVELADLGAPDLELVLGAMDQDLRLDWVPRTNGDLDDLTLDDLTADQLQLVLRSLEG